MRPLAIRSLPLFLALALLMAGNGLHGSLLGLRAGIEEFDTRMIGVVMSAYYVGFLAGSLIGPRMITRVGHIRSFAGLASLASASVLVHVVQTTPLSWALLRFASGFCISGLFLIAETWLNSTATNAVRGKLLGIYMVTVAGSVGGGQLLLNAADPAGFAAFVLASVLISLAVVPLALARVSAPEETVIERVSLREVFQTAPLAIVGSAASGAVTGALLGLGAVYAASIGLSVAQTSVLLASVLVGALVLQFPIGAVSDRFDRRRVIAAVAFTGALVSGVAAMVDGAERFTVLVLAVAIAGGLGYPLYSLSNAHLNDYLKSGHVIGAGAKIVLINGAGAITGPVVAALALDVSAGAGFFGALVVVYAATGAYALYRLTRRAAVPADERAHFVPVPAGVSPAAVALAPSAAEEMFPTDQGLAATSDGWYVRWQERGSGPPVVLVPPEEGSISSWSEQPLILADAGFRVIVFDRSRRSAGEVDTQVADLELVLRECDVAACHLVALGNGARAVSAFAGRWPERVESVVSIALDGEADDIRLPPLPERTPLLAMHADDPGSIGDALAEFLRSVPDRHVRT